MNKKSYYLFLLLIFITFFSCIPAFANVPVEVLTNYSVETEIEKIIVTLVVKEAFQLDTHYSPYKKARAKVIYDFSFEAEYIVVYLLYKDIYKMETGQIILGKDFSIESVELPYVESEKDLRQCAAPPVCRGCPDDTVDFVFGTVGEEPTAIDGVRIQRC
jgi:hypothetical protein